MNISFWDKLKVFGCNFIGATYCFHIPLQDFTHSEQKLCAQSSALNVASFEPPGTSLIDSPHPAISIISLPLYIWRNNARWIFPITSGDTTPPARGAFPVLAPIAIISPKLKNPKRKPLQPKAFKSRRASASQGVFRGIVLSPSRADLRQGLSDRVQIQQQLLVGLGNVTSTHRPRGMTIPR